MLMSEHKVCKGCQNWFLAEAVGCDAPLGRPGAYSVPRTWMMTPLARFEGQSQQLSLSDHLLPAKRTRKLKAMSCCFSYYLNAHRK